MSLSTGLAILAICIAVIGLVLPIPIPDGQISQNGTSTCTILTNNQSCSVTVSFPNSFPFTNPKISMTAIGNSPTGNPLSIPVKTVPVIDYNASGIVWKGGMPPQTTEIFGENGQHWEYVDTTAMSLVSLMATCVTPSLTVFPDAQLVVQYSLNITTPLWVNTTSGQVGTFVNNGICGPLPITPVSDGPNGGHRTFVIPSQNPLLLRVVGMFGGGPGDNVALSLVTMTFYQQVFNPLYSSIINPFGQGSKNTFTAVWRVEFLPVSTISFTFSWIATECLDNSGSC